MFASTSFATAKVLLQLIQPPIAAPAKRDKPVCQPEARLWKLSVVSRREHAAIELFALIVFLCFAVAGCWSCFAELFKF
jgi:hypothetical protein